MDAIIEMPEPKKRDSNAKYLFHGLAWPAVAGNVAWAFITVIITPSLVPPAEWPARTAVLLLLAVYLGGDWIRVRDEPGRPWYWFWDALHLISISTFAISTVTMNPQNRLAGVLIIVFLLTAAGHASGGFTPDRKARWYYAGANASGAVIALYSVFRRPESAWPLPASVLFVLVVWLSFRIVKPWIPREVKPKVKREETLVSAPVVDKLAETVGPGETPHT